MVMIQRPPGPPQASTGTTESAFDLGWIGRSTGRGERRQVVVLAIGFAALEVDDPEQLVEAQSARRELVAAIAHRFGGVVSHREINLHLIAWGWPQAGEADTRFAIAAALEFASTRSLAIQCSIDAGIAVTAEEGGFPGLGFVGEMVGTAVLLLAAARPGEVLVSEAVARLAAPAVSLEHHGAVAGQGNAWRVLGLDCRSCLDEMMASPTAALIGRSAGMHRLLEAWTSAVNRKANLMLVEGEAGVGKSALLQWFESEVSRSGGKSVLVECRPESSTLPFEPIRQMLHSLARLGENDACAPEAQSKASNGESPSPTGTELLADCLVALSNEHACEATVSDALQALIRDKAARVPVLVLIEDLQWADTSTASVLTDLAGLADTPAHVLVVVGARPGTRSIAVQKDRRWQVMKLGRLALDEIRYIVDTCRHASDLSLDIRERIAERASGVPFHALELAKLCAEHADAEAHHRLLARPNRLNAVLTSRLDALATLKPLAQAAAVLGQVFDCRVLAAALEIEGRLIKERLDMLAGMGLFTVVKGHSGWCYRFHDALLWSQAYGSVLKGKRRQLHRKLADVLEAQGDEKLGCEPETIAHHWKKAGRPEKAFEWWVSAALAAAERAEAARAVSFINEALAAKEIAPAACSPHDEATLMSVLGAQLHVLRGSASNETVAAYERAMELVSAMPAKPDALDLEIAWGLVTIHLVRGDVRAANEASSRLLSEATERSRTDILLVGLRVHGTARLLAGHVPEAVAIFKDAVSRYDRKEHRELLRRFVSDPGPVTLAHLGSAQALAGDWTGARASRRQALSLTNETRHAHTSANVLGVLALGAVHMGEPGIAAALSRACGEIAAEHGFKYWQARSELVLAWGAGQRNPDESLDRIGAAVEAYRATGAGRAAVLATCMAAEIAVKSRRYEEALEFLKPVKAIAEQRGEFIYLPEALRLMALAMALGRQANVARAFEVLLDAETLARQHGSTTYLSRIVAARHEIQA